MYLGFLLKQFKIQLYGKTAGIRKRRKKLTIIAVIILIPVIIFAVKGMVTRSSTNHSSQSSVFLWPGSMISIAEIAGIAAITSGSIYAVYRKKENSIAQLPVLTKKENEK
jgi:hypothetical protein